MDLTLPPDFREFIASCIAREVRFLIVGGYALAAHGHPRATKDLDVWLWLDPANADRVVEALDDFGLGSSGLGPEDFLEPDTIIQLGYVPLRIDLLTMISGVRFEDCWERRIPLEVDGLVAGLIARDDLIANKVAAGRAQDLADVEILRGLGSEE